MKNAFIAVSVVDLIALVVLCFFIKCNIDIISLVVAAVVLLAGGFVNFKMIKKLKEKEA